MLPAFVLRKNENRKPARRRRYIRLSGSATTLRDLCPSRIRSYDRCRVATRSRTSWWEEADSTERFASF